MEMKETLAALKAEFPDRPEFVIAQLTKGNDLEAAKGEFQALRLTELEAANTELKAEAKVLKDDAAKKDAAAEKLAAEKVETARLAKEVSDAGEEGEGVEHQPSTDGDADVQFTALAKKYALDNKVPYTKAILAVGEEHPELANKVGA